MTQERTTYDVTSRVANVTPELAEEWLGRNTHNRNLRQGTVDSFSRDMAAGGWALNGEAIKFANDGSLLDGQHRLWAVVEANVAVEMLVVEGLPPESQDTMDSGVKRTAADMLTLSGESNPIILAALARRVCIYDQVGREHANMLGRSATKAEIKGVIETYPDLKDAADFASHNRKAIDLPPGVLGFCYWRLNQIDEEHAELFFERLITGAELSRDDPILVLRKRLREAINSGTRTSDHFLIAYVFKAWNASRKGETMSLLRLTKREAFPTPT